MGKWAGIAAGIETTEARKEKELAQAKLDAQYDEGMRLKKVGMLAKYASKHGSSFTGGDYQTASAGSNKVSLKSSNHYINLLSSLDIKDELITQAAGYGPKNLKMITERFQKTQAKHQELYGKNSEMPTQLYNDALESLIITQRKNPIFDITKYEELFDVKLTDVEALMLTPQSNKYPDITFAPNSLYLEGKSTQAELSIVDKRGVQFIQGRATQEMSALNKRASEILKISEQTEGNLSDVIQAEKTWINNRIAEVNEALTDNKDGNFAPLAFLYGNNFMQEIIKYDPKLQNAPLNPAFTTQRDTTISVPNREVARILVDSGIIVPPAILYDVSTNSTIPVSMLVEVP